MYDPRMVQPMRDEVTSLGVKELTTPEDVDAVMSEKEGTTLVFVNSVCGCAAGNARPALRQIVENAVKPDRMVTVFAGQDREATQQARSYFTGQPPSSPCFALLKDGDLVGMLHRHNIEGRTADDVAGDLTAAFDKFCSA
ncbi:MAG: BrxA/BrxB family bacilliredoxin [Planctomycetota bacterium]|jgi:putative YphP/YqiW family bacilliredoxin